MKLHEYQSKAILKKAGLPVPRSVHVERPDQVANALDSSGILRGVGKAQAYTGGRGKAGGIRLFTTVQQAIDFTSNMIGNKLITHQSGPEGVKIHSVLIEEASEIERELYIAVLLDRGKINPLIMISPDGGMDIEEVAEKTPERILKIYPPFNQPVGFDDIEKAAGFLGLHGNLKSEFADVIQKLYRVYLDYDAMLVEINPLIVTKDNHLSILDCKFDIDDNALFRQAGSGGDPNADKNEAEIEASKYGMSYISLGGTIGCMVNGAGLAMATIDSIKHNGGEPANFLDVGGSASEEAVVKAFEIISSDRSVDCILVNIFGGIMKCDTIANGIVSAIKKVGLKVPLVVRLEGTNVELGKEILDQSGLNIINASNLDDAARKAVEVTKKSK
jgi:succinyl-CoA synthetase beta subunit